VVGTHDGSDTRLVPARTSRRGARVRPAISGSPSSLLAFSSGTSARSRIAPDLPAGVDLESYGVSVAHPTADAASAGRTSELGEALIAYECRRALDPLMRSVRGGLRHFEPASRSRHPGGSYLGTWGKYPREVARSATLDGAARVRVPRHSSASRLLAAGSERLFDGLDEASWRRALRRMTTLRNDRPRWVPNPHESWRPPLDRTRAD